MVRSAWELLAQQLAALRGFGNTDCTCACVAAGGSHKRLGVVEDGHQFHSLLQRARRPYRVAVV